MIVAFSSSLIRAMRREIEAVASDIGEDNLSGVEETVGDHLSGPDRREWEKLISEHGFRAVTQAVRKQFNL